MILRRTSAPDGSAALPLELVSRLAVGGMAELYLARDAAGLPVVLKRGKGPADDAWLLREAALTLPLSHPNLVRTLAQVEIASRPCLVLELVDGCDLDRLQRARANPPLPTALAAHLCREVAAGLAHAHAAHPAVVHGDVNASNVLVSRGGEVKLADFGIAEPAGAAPSASGLGGKAGSLAPERLGGGRADPRSDLFSLGLLLLELLRGAPLFEGDTAARLEALAQFHPRQVTRPEDTPAGLWDLVQQLLQPDPARRLAHAHEALEALTEFCVAAGPAQVAALFHLALPHFESLTAAATFAAAPSDAPPDPAPAPDAVQARLIDALDRPRLTPDSAHRPDPAHPSTGLLALSDAELRALPLPAELLRKLPRAWAERLGVVPVAARGSGLVVAMAEPEPRALIASIERATGCVPVRGALADAAAIREAIARGYDAAGIRREPLLKL